MPNKHSRQKSSSLCQDKSIFGNCFNNIIIPLVGYEINEVSSAVRESLAIFGYLTRAKEIVTVDLQLTRFIREWEY